MSAWTLTAGVVTAAGHGPVAAKAGAFTGSVEVPVGECWDVVRVTKGVGWLALRRLQADGPQLGPVLDVPARWTLEFVVPPGTARLWPPMPTTRCVDHGMTRWPAPPDGDSDRPARGGRRWIVPPPRPACDPDALCEAIARALYRAKCGHPRMRSLGAA